MNGLLKSLAGCCAVIAVSIIAAGDMPIGDPGRGPLTAAHAETAPAGTTDFSELRAQADAALRMLIEAQTGKGAT